MSARLDNAETAPKTNSSIISRFSDTKKFPSIPSTLINDKLISDLQKKANLINNHFNFQFTPVKNASTLPKDINDI